MTGLKRIPKKIVSRSGNSATGDGEFTTGAESSSLSKELEQTLGQLREKLGESNDLVFREFTLGDSRETRALLVFVDGLVDKGTVQENIMKPLMLAGSAVLPEHGNLMQQIKAKALTVGDIDEAAGLQKLIHAVLCGDTALLVDGAQTALIISSRGWEARGVTEPTTEAVVRGPREGFTETLRTNTALLRRKIKNPALRIESVILGKLTVTDVAVVYIREVAKEELVNEVLARLRRINIDGVLESGYLEEFIEENRYSPFPQIEHSERPDKVAAALLEGRVAILVDGTPFVLLVPTVFVNFFQSSEDYYERYWFGTLVRWGRVVGFLATVFLPAIYLAIITMHQESLPTSLALTIAGAREGIPFPAFVEVMLMELTFEALREAGVRLPRPVGQAVSIVGALVMGDAAVRTKLASPATVMVVAFAGIASFTVPSYNLIIAVRIIRFPMIMLAGSMGLPGVVAGMMVLLVHLASLRSFGVPYLAPVAPVIGKDLKDVVVRVPWWAMVTRPQTWGSRRDQTRLKSRR